MDRLLAMARLNGHKTIIMGTMITVMKSAACVCAEQCGCARRTRIDAEIGVAM